MAKSFDRGYGRSLRMHDRLIELATRTQFTPGEAAVYEASKRAWTPERWAHRAAPTQVQPQPEPKPLDLSALKAKWG